MIDRRLFVSLLALAALPLPRVAWAGGSGGDVLSKIIARAEREAWSEIPTGELMGLIGKEFLGVPYVGGTLEGAGPEVCRLDLGGLDCVTYFENALGIARMIQVHGDSIQDLMNEITYTRYRGGELDGYISRLHYTAEWISDNIKKNVVKDITSDLGGVPLDIHVDFMSKHPQYYTPLKNDPALVKRIAKIEASINATPRTYIPKGKIRAIESQLQTGDIIAVATSKKGLDYAHTGMILRKDGVSHFMHASTTHKKVLIDKPIGEYVAGVKAHTGITAVRPL